MSAEQGSLNAQYILEYMYELGQGIPKDYSDLHSYAFTFTSYTGPLLLHAPQPVVRMETEESSIS